MPIKELNILVAEDDHDQALLLKQCFLMGKLKHSLNFVHDGEELLDYVNATGSYHHRSGLPLPHLIFLDLNMPKKDGRTILKQLKADSTFQHIPIIVFSTSNAPFDIATSYANGANTYICKPHDFTMLIELMKKLTNYWSQIVSLPC